MYIVILSREDVGMLLWRDVDAEARYKVDAKGALFCPTRFGGSVPLPLFTKRCIVVP
jgi:hypothetical protein